MPAEPPPALVTPAADTGGVVGPLLLCLFAHDIRGPLATAAATLDDVIRDPDSISADLRGLLSSVRTDLDGIQRVLDELVTAERLQHHPDPPRDRPVGLAAVLLAAARDVDLAGHRLHVTVPTVEAVGDPALVGRAVRNLVVNAATHTPWGTSVWIRAAEDGRGGVVVVVEDDGPGVPAGQQETIFSPFVRAAPDTTPGLGLGLALVRQVAEHLGGSAWVETRPGGGASFRVRLPRWRDASAVDRPADRP